MMNETESRNLDMLRIGPCVSPEYLDGYYGLSWPLPESTTQSYERSITRPTACESGCSRYDLEHYMLRQAVLPKKWAAARVGMEVGSLDELLKRLPELGMRPERYAFDDVFVADSLIDDLIPNLPGLRFRTFSDHDSFCRQFHEALKQVLHIEAKKLLCETSKILGDYPLRLARDFDCLTMQPLSPHHTLWLEFRKPLYLAPDRCSKLLYAENREILRPFCSGDHEPDDLDRYSHFLAERSHA